MRLTVRIARAVALAVAAGLVVSGCAGGTSYDDDTARDLQQQTLAVTTAAADGDWNAAAMRLMALEADARDAHARGLVSTERLESIIAAIALVAASVEAERVAVEGQGGVGVGVREEGVVDGEVHAGHARDGSPPPASRFLTDRGAGPAG